MACTLRYAKDTPDCATIQRLANLDVILNPQSDEGIASLFELKSEPCAVAFPAAWV